MIPDWLMHDNAAVSLPPGESRNRGRGFLERTIEGSAEFLRDAVLSETIAGRHGLLQSLDPRIRLLSVLTLIVCVSLFRSPALIWGMYFFVLLLAAASSVPLPFFVKRVWLFIPLFSAVIAIPALFNIVTPGDPIWTIAHLERKYDFGPYHLPETISITRQGIVTAITFIGRVAASVSLAVLLTLTTGWSDLLRALSVLRVPQIFILVLGMTYRYIILLTQTVQNIHIARKSRTLRYGATGEEQRWVASRMGYLFKRTWRMSQDVHMAMLSRGYSGEVRALTNFKAGQPDYAWLLFVAMVCAAALIADHVLICR